jgi:hypothetical protein
LISAIDWSHCHPATATPRPPTLVSARCVAEAMSGVVVKYSEKVRRSEAAWGDFLSVNYR